MVSPLYRHSMASARRRRVALTFLCTAEQEEHGENSGGQTLLVPPVSCGQELDGEAPELAELLHLQRSVTWLITGDSLVTLADGENSGGGFSSCLTRLIRDRLQRHRDTYIVNDQGNERLRVLSADARRRIARFSPEIVVLTFGAAELQDDQGSLVEFERNFHEFVSLIREHGGTVVVNLPPYYRGAEGSEGVQRLIKLEAIRGCAKEASVPVVDHWQHWEEHAVTDWYLSDGIHPSGRGCEEMVEHFFRELRLDPQAGPFHTRPLRV